MRPFLFFCFIQWTFSSWEFYFKYFIQLRMTIKATRKIMKNKSDSKQLIDKLTATVWLLNSFKVYIGTRENDIQSNCCCCCDHHFETFSRCDVTQS